MADATKRERTERYVDYVLPNPTCIGEFYKALRWAQKDAEDSHDGGRVDTSYDDWLTISGDEEHIVLTWQPRPGVGG